MSDGRRLRLRHAVLILGIGGIGVWQARSILAETAADLYLSRLGIEGRYDVEALSPGNLVLSNVRLGPAATPDFAAERVEVAIGGYPFTPHVSSVHLVAPRLRLSFTDKGLSFGSLDALLPGTSAEPTRLPDTRLRIDKGRLEAATPLGPIVLEVSSDGRLADGFEAQATLAPTLMRAGNCRVPALSGRLSVATQAQTLAIEGDGEAPSADCAGAVVHSLTWKAEAKASPKFDNLGGTLALAAGRLESRFGTAKAPAGRIRFAGAMDHLAGSWSASAGATRWRSGALGNAGARGSFEAEPALKQARIKGTALARAVSLDLVPAFDKGTPTILAELVSRAGAAARRFDLSAPFDVRLNGQRYDLRVPRLEIAAASGARIELDSGAGLRLTSATRAVDGRLSLRGGGLPTAEVQFAAFDLGERTSGQMRLNIAPWRTRGAEIAVSELTVSPTPGGFAAAGRLLYSGPVGADARVKGLAVAFAADGRPEQGLYRLQSPCASVGFAALDSGDLRLGSTRTEICREGSLEWGNGRLAGGLRIAPLRLTGSQGGRPLRLASSAMRLTVRGNAVRLQPVAIDGAVGAYGAKARIDAALDLGGKGPAATGHVTDLALTSGDLPVHIDQARASWSLAGGTLRAASIEARVRDAMPDARFQPLRVAAATAVLAGDRIEADGSGRLAASGERLFGFTLHHDLSSASGVAALDTGALAFSDRLQPYEITEALRGVIENVAGTVHGTGTVQWTADSLSSSGQVAVQGVSLATAALGPVTGINGTVAIDDLFALTTPPGQVLTVASMNPGVLVEDGRFRFRMLGPTAAHIEDARWPFAGGMLTLRPVTISADEPRRAFTLDVTGIDAGQFLQRFELSNVNATGTFDGTLPLLFDGSAGRIVGGKLEARPSGGLLQYVGDVGADSMGAAGKLAFDALKRLRYRSLSVTLDGDLDGELVTAIRFTGTNEAPVEPAAGVPLRTAGLPFKFNVTVRAPFRRLLGTAASFSDAREIIKSAAPAETPPEGEPVAVQPR